MRNGLADATWYTCDVPKEDMRQLLTRKDWPGIRDTLAWFSLLGLTAWASLHLLNAHSWWAVIPYLAYCTIYFSSSNSRWHETSHGTAFKSAWLNEALYEISSFMNFRQSTLWRWSHSRHLCSCFGIHKGLLGGPFLLVNSRRHNFKQYLFSYPATRPDVYCSIFYRRLADAGLRPITTCRPR